MGLEVSQFTARHVSARFLSGFLLLSSGGFLFLYLLVRDELRAGLRRLRQQRQREAAPVADRAGGLREVPGSGVGERRQEHLQDPVEARGQTGLQPGRGRRAFQGEAAEDGDEPCVKTHSWTGRALHPAMRFKVYFTSKYSDSRTFI